ncbi:hypothetical protein F7725_018692 [Dissostichus mawsoni]|uniref:Uncharacterized protein n=1 Tax=Dissostichus mawsoni TaxID=36200 RepID=A0A7J5XS59_DISMA|nr:hypothetical protein F7725_018692 [Dissostichus mawsoni]
MEVMIRRVGLSLHIKRKGSRGRNDVETGEETQRGHGKWDTRTSNTSGANKHHLYFPMDNILTTSSLDLHKEKEYYVDKMQSTEGKIKRESHSEKERRKRGISRAALSYQEPSLRSRTKPSSAAVVTALLVCEGFSRGSPRNYDSSITSMTIVRGPVRIRLLTVR